MVGVRVWTDLVHMYSRIHKARQGCNTAVLGTVGQGPRPVDL